jgi:hypothetical protein
MLLALVQVIIALVVVIVLFVVAFYIYNREYIQAIQTATQTRRTVDIFKGIKDLATNNDEKYETQDRTNPSFKDMRLSVNQKGGAEFSYNFWLYKNQSNLENSIPVDTLSNTTDAGLRTDDIILILKGLKQTYTYKNLCNKEKTDLLVKCPTIKLQQRGKVLSVEVNTIHGPDNVHESSRDTCRDLSRDWKTRNSHLVALDGLNAVNFDKKWFMVSVIVQDVTPYDPLPFRNRVRIAIYINGVLELDRYVEGKLASMGDDATVIRQNNAPLFIAPKITFDRFNRIHPDTAALEYTPSKKAGIPDNFPEKVLYMADATYFNYVLSEDEIKALFANRFSTNVAPSPADTQIARDVIADMKESIAYTSGEKQLAEF